MIMPPANITVFPCNHSVRPLHDHQPGDGKALNDCWIVPPDTDFQVVCVRAARAMVRLASGRARTQPRLEQPDLAAPRGPARMRQKGNIFSRGRDDSRARGGLAPHPRPVASRRGAVRRSGDGNGTIAVMAVAAAAVAWSTKQGTPAGRKHSAR